MTISDDLTTWPRIDVEQPLPPGVTVHGAFWDGKPTIAVWDGQRHSAFLYRIGWEDDLLKIALDQLRTARAERLVPPFFTRF